MRTLRRQDSLTTTNTETTYSMETSSVSTHHFNTSPQHRRSPTSSRENNSNSTNATANTNSPRGSTGVPASPMQPPAQPLVPTRNPPNSTGLPSLPSKRSCVARKHLVRAVIHDFYDDLNSNITSKSIEIWKSLYERYHSPSYIMVRPSGNPCDTAGFIQMLIAKDVEIYEFKLQSVDNVQLIADDTVAIVTYTVDQKFKFKNTHHEDRVTNTCILEDCNGDIKICHEQRSTGRPIPQDDQAQ
uniref:Uncharacterized protein n=1 Tax=Craspedostauros australis TaxID=1486917 RepID=A0A7R9WT09_9STRA